MPISQQTLDTLEFPKILAQLARHTSFGASRELALALLPSTDAFEVRRRQKRTTEARRLLDEQPDATIGGARDVRAAMGLARRGGVLEAGVFLDIAATLSAARRLRAMILKQSEEIYPLLRELAHDLPSIQALEDAIARTVGEDGHVLDSASPALGRLRADVRIAFNRLQDKLQSMISSSQSESLQEPIITVRNGRYVVPVKASHRRNIRGLVHDQSASGATLYIEPLAVVELNNKYRQLQLAEEEEVQRILAELSGQVGEHAGPITVGVEALADIDLAFAMARYALALGCSEPEIVDGTSDKGRATRDERRAMSGEPLLVLRSARHPLLDPKTVVPTNLHLGGDFRLLLITGPNTGGKTVALKTTGLLALMAQAGMHIPAVEPSRVPVFGQVFADIGDEQSIEQSLSTFSSHMTNIIRILRALGGGAGGNAPRKPPVFSEGRGPSEPPQAGGLGVADPQGTTSLASEGRGPSEPPQAGGLGVADPQEHLARGSSEGRSPSDEPRRGASLRQQAAQRDEIERLSNWRKVAPGEWAPLEALTPEPELALVLLDELGAGTDPVEGAALARAIVERLLERGVLGVATTHYAELKAFAYATPGVQNASVEFNVETLAPTYRLSIGLPGRSNALAIAARLGLDETLVERARSTMAREDAQVEDLLAGIHREREASAVELAQAERARREAEAERAQLSEALAEFEAQRESEWRSAREEIEAELRDARNQIRRLRDEFRSVSLSKQWMEEAEKRLADASAMVPQARPGARAQHAAPAGPPPPQAPRPLQPGDTVQVRSVGLTGEIIAIDEDEGAAEVQVGGFRMRADLRELTRQKASDAKSNTRQQRVIEQARVSFPDVPDISIEIDMRGWRAAEVADRLDRYLNDAYLAGLPMVRIIHGKGTGALRQVVRDILKTHKLVESYGSGVAGEGGEGVTVARMAER
jgi:MutS2 family protein